MSSSLTEPKSASAAHTSTAAEAAAAEEAPKGTSTTTTAATAAGASTSTAEESKEESTSIRAIPPGHELIIEGTARMIYPKVADDEANAVFYNLVQVQNRDLSVLMLTLYAERRAKRRAVKAKKKELLREAREEAEAAAAPTGAGGATAGKVRHAKVDHAKIQSQLDSYVESTDWTQHVASSAGPNPPDGMRILDALAASGLRSIRYWNEVPGIRQVIINDLDPAAVQQARDNVAYNGLEGVLLEGDYASASNNGSNDNDDDNDNGDGGPTTTSSAPPPAGIIVQNGDATHVMYTSRRPPDLRTHQHPTQSQLHPQFDVIDLDPYGSSSPFIDAAVQSVVSGGMLAVTCTDMAALGGSHPETCYGRYGSMPMPRSKYLQEMALRILLYSLSTAAARYGRTIRPVLSVGMAFYVRVFVEVWDDKAGVNNVSLNHGSVYQSTQCPSYHIVPHGQHGPRNKNVYQPGRAPPVPCCEETGGPFKVGGPIWTGPLHDLDVVDEAVSRLELMKDGGGGGASSTTTVHLLKMRTALHGLLTVVSEELPDVPLYYTLPDLCHTVRCACPPLMQVRAALVNAGYRVSAYHKEPQAIKTDAPNRVVWDVIRAWCRDHPPKEDGKKSRRKERKRQAAILAEEGQETAAAAAADGQADSVSAGAKILAVEPTTEIDFSIPKGFDKKKKAQRFPLNPEANWGPKKAASGKRKVPQEMSGEPASKVAKPR